MLRVAFICVHNSCRSQIAEALARHLASDVIDACSAGTEVKPNINQDAVRLMKEIYQIDMEQEGQYSKLTSEITKSPVDILITMGCNVKCPYIPNQISFDWGLDDPTGQSDSVFLSVIKKIETNILQLRSQIQSGKIYSLYRKTQPYNFSKYIPFWADLTEPQKSIVSNSWRIDYLKKGTILHRTSDGCKGLVYLLGGTIRCFMLSEDGRDVTLYRIYKDEVCSLCQSDLIESLETEIILEPTEDTAMITIPSHIFSQIIEENLKVQLYLYKEGTRKFSELLNNIQQILFKKLDQRIADFLLSEYERTGSYTLLITHEEIARSIGSAREAVTRMITYFCREKILTTSRGKIEIIDLKKLKSII